MVVVVPVFVVKLIRLGLLAYINQIGLASGCAKFQHLSMSIRGVKFVVVGGLVGGTRGYYI